MNAIEFIKENYTLTNGGEDYICNHSGQLVGAEDIAEAYHQAKLKLLGIADVVNRRELLVAFLEWFKGYCDLDVTPNEEDIDLFLSN